MGIHSAFTQTGGWGGWSREGLECRWLFPACVALWQGSHEDQILLNNFQKVGGWTKSRGGQRTTAEGIQKWPGPLTSSFRARTAPDVQGRCSNEEKETKIQRGYREGNRTEDYFAGSAIFTEHTKQAGHITDQHRWQFQCTQGKIKSGLWLPACATSWGRCWRGTFHLWPVMLFYSKSGTCIRAIFSITHVTSVSPWVHEDASQRTWACKPRG